MIYEGDDNMLYRKLSFTDKKAAAVALGTASFGGTTEKSEAFEIMDTYAEAGGNVLDTARVYGDFASFTPGGSEEVIGKWLASRGNRDSLILATKGMHPDMRTMHTPRSSREELLSDAKASIDALGAEYVDIYYLHRDDESLPVGRIVDNLNEIYALGIAKAFGASNWSASRIREANAYARKHGLIGFAINEPQLSLAKTAHFADDTLFMMDEEMWRMHKDEKMPCMAFSSMANGYLAKLAEGRPVSESLARTYGCPESEAALEAVKKINAETGYSVSAISLSWMLDLEPVVLPIIGPKNAAQALLAAEVCESRLTVEQTRLLRDIRGLN